MPVDILAELTDSQRQAVTHGDGPCLVVAGAGTGKTKVITHRIAYLILKAGVVPEQITALTFTDKAAREMEERLDLLLPYGVTGTAISTFHSFCAELVRRHAFLIGLTPSARLMTTADEVAFLRRHLAELPTSLYKPNRNPVEFLRSLSGFMSKAQDELLKPTTIVTHAQDLAKGAGDEASREQATKLAELGILYEKAQELYRDEGILSYGNLITYAYELLNQYPSVRSEEADRIRYLLIDEFQDTNTAQNEVARLLVQPTNNIMAVGDDDQAIYSFRGANLTNILSFTHTYPGTQIIPLTDNFRSTAPILEAAYRLIRHNDPVRLEVQEHISKQLKSHQSGDTPPLHLHYQRSASEYQAIADEISSLVESGNYQLNEIAILVRARAHSRGVEAVLRSRGIPFAQAGDVKFYDQTIIRAALSYLRFLDDPDLDANLFFCLTHPPFNLPERSLQLHLGAARYANLSLYEYFTRNQESEDSVLQESLAYLSRGLERPEKLPSQLLLRHLHDSDLYSSLSADTQACELLGSLYEELQSFEATHRNATVGEYIPYLDYLLATEEEVALQQPSDTSTEGVQIMTIHKSKGLEFPVVFITNLVQGRFPGRNQSDPLPFPYELIRKGESTATGSEEFLREERRLAYVAMTRAKERLYLTSSELYEDRKTRAKPSPFIMEALGSTSAPLPQMSTPAETIVNPPEITVPSSPVRSAPAILSPSALETYDQCPRKYRYQYVFKVKVPASHLVNFGISIHETLRAWMLARSQSHPTSLEALYRAAWVGGGYENRRQEEERYAEGLAALHSYVDTLPDELSLLALERSCQFRLSDGTTVSGKIDRIDQLENGELRVIDYKTGENPKKSRELITDIPLGSYILALRQEGKKVVQAQLEYIMIGESVTVEVDQMDLEGVEAKIRSLGEAIRHDLESDTFKAQPDKIRCAYCDYRNICPFRWGRQ